MKNVPDAQGNFVIDATSKEFTNPAQKHYHEMQVIHDTKNGRPITNNFYLYADHPVGTAYLVHGYYGSPLDEFVCPTAMEFWQNQFNVCVIESYDLSSTSQPNAVREKKYVNLDRFHKSVHRGMRAARNKKLSGSYTILVGHCLGAHAIAANLSMHYAKNPFFQEIVFVSPYLMPSQKIEGIKSRLTPRDWQRISAFSLTEKTQIQIDGKPFDIKYNMNFFDYEFPGVKVNAGPTGYDTNEYLKAIFEQKFTKVFENWKDTSITFVCGDKDTVISYADMLTLFNQLPSQYKKFITIPNAGHFSDNSGGQGIKRAMQEIILNAHMSAIRND